MSHTNQSPIKKDELSPLPMEQSITEQTDDEIPVNCTAKSNDNIITIENVEDDQNEENYHSENDEDDEAESTATPQFAPQLQIQQLSNKPPLTLISLTDPSLSNNNNDSNPTLSDIDQLSSKLNHMPSLRLHRTIKTNPSLISSNNSKSSEHAFIPSSRTPTPYSHLSSNNESTSTREHKHDNDSNDDNDDNDEKESKNNSLTTEINANSDPLHFRQKRVCFVSIIQLQRALINIPPFILENAIFAFGMKRSWLFPQTEQEREEANNCYIQRFKSSWSHNFIQMILDKDKQGHILWIEPFDTNINGTSHDQDQQWNKISEQLSKIVDLSLSVSPSSFAENIRYLSANIAHNANVNMQRSIQFESVHPMTDDEDVRTDSDYDDNVDIMNIDEDDNELPGFVMTETKSRPSKTDIFEEHEQKNGITISENKDKSKMIKISTVSIAQQIIDSTTNRAVIDFDRINETSSEFKETEIKRTKNCTQKGIP